MRPLNCHLVDLTCIPDIKLSLALGYLEAYALADASIRERVRFHKHCYYIGDGIESITQSFLAKFDGGDASPPDVVGFTIYFWNNELSRRMARAIKERFPSALIIFGGNDVTNQGEGLLRESNFVDVVCNGEGERVFKNFLTQVLSGEPDLGEVRGLTFRGRDGSVLTTPGEDRISDLGEIPSPFLTGVFSGRDVKNSRVIVYEFSRGCPYKCSFCYWGGAINTRVRRFSLDRIGRDLSFILEHMEENSTLFLADANFGMVDHDVEIARLLAGTLRGVNKSVFLFANWAKNTTRRVVEAARILFEGRLITSVTLSAQSLNDEALLHAQRKNIPFEYYRKLQAEFNDLGIPTYTELLLGMPGESYDSFMEGVERVIESGGHPVIYPLLLLNNTDYARPEVRERFSLRTRLMPYQMFSDYAQVEVVVGHSRLSYEEWLRALSLRLIISVFNHGVLKHVLSKIHETHGIPFVRMCECIHGYVSGGRLRSEPRVEPLFRNYVESWGDYRRYDAELIRGILGRRFIEDHVHYQAIMKVILAGGASSDAFVEEVSRFVAAELCGEGFASGDALRGWIAEQQAIVRAMARIAKNDAGVAGADIRPELFGTAFDTFVLGIYHGSIDTLRLFEPAARAPRADSRGPSASGLPGRARSG
jgi:radical SAM superfamily enzyme YgiQ (UPF0313 family)